MANFRKLVAIEPVGLVPQYEEKLRTLAEEVIMYDTIPEDDNQIAERIGDADAVLLSYTSRIGSEVIDRCPDIRYIGMCCSLYSPESANVDILHATSKGITVTGIRDYGDEGVVEYVISELVRCLHGFGPGAFDGKPWEGIPREITGLKAGIVGLGKSGGMIADALKFFGADISYFARSEKEYAKAKGYRFLPLRQLLAESDAVFCCLNKNTVLLHEEEFRSLGNGKILFNTGLSPAWDEKPFVEWITAGHDSPRANLCFCDTMGALGSRHLAEMPGVRCMDVSTGRTVQAFDRLSTKVLDNIVSYQKTIGETRF